MFRFFTMRSCKPLFQTSTWRTTLFGCLRLRIQYICSYCPYSEAASFMRKLGKRNAVLTGTNLSRNYHSYFVK